MTKPVILNQPASSIEFDFVLDSGAVIEMVGTGEVEIYSRITDELMVTISDSVAWAYNKASGLNVYGVVTSGSNISLYTTP
jgi:hypothetical protein